MHRFRCVELNYPAPIAGCALFDWHNMADRLSLHELPFELRWAIDRVGENVRWVYGAVKKVKHSSTMY